MSELVDALIASAGKREPMMFPFDYRVSERFSPEPAVPTRQEWTFSFSYSSTRTLPYGLFDEALRQEKIALNELIYGDFRRDILELNRRATDNGDIGLAIAADKLYRRVCP